MLRRVDGVPGAQAVSIGQARAVRRASRRVCGPPAWRWRWRSPCSRKLQRTPRATRPRSLGVLCPIEPIRAIHSQMLDRSTRSSPGRRAGRLRAREAPRGTSPSRSTSRSRRPGCATTYSAGRAGEFAPLEETSSSPRPCSRFALWRVPILPETAERNHRASVKEPTSLADIAKNMQGRERGEETYRTIFCALKRQRPYVRELPKRSAERASQLVSG